MQCAPPLIARRYHDAKVKTPRGNGVTPRTPRSVRFSDEPQEEGTPPPRTPRNHPPPSPPSASPRRSPRAGGGVDVGKALQVVARPVGQATFTVAKAPLQVPQQLQQLLLHVDDRAAEFALTPWSRPCHGHSPSPASVHLTGDIVWSFKVPNLSMYVCFTTAKPSRLVHFRYRHVEQRSVISAKRCSASSLNDC